ncbi:MAG: acyl-CoA dehydrogenase [Candidatus Aminicenantes bacterium RBG_13_63_10]|nr:MAG: acyl-CoA dehydrogenase [Candidatus Aminicenantes bacterium RBG_13_63_10]
MNFDLSEEQILMREMIRDFARKEIAPREAELEDREEFPKDILRRLGELGLLGMTVPAEFGGQPVDSLSQVLVLEELAKASAAVCVIVSVHCSLFCHSLALYGTEELKRKYLPAAARGNILGAFSLTEPNAGSDAMAIRTSAVRRGDQFILNGRKAWVTNGREAGAVILLTSGADPAGRRRLNAFVVEPGFFGYKVTKVEKKMGLHSSPTAELTLEDCQVPAMNLLGAEGQGSAIALNGLDHSRVGIAAQSVGLAERALEEAVRYAKQREAFGRKIADFQAIQFMLADIATRTEAARWLTYRAALLKDSGLPFTAEAAMAKLFASEAAKQASDHALQIHGGYGYSHEYAVERIYRDARVLTLYEGTSEIQRLVIARQLLKET